MIILPTIQIISTISHETKNDLNPGENTAAATNKEVTNN